MEKFIKLLKETEYPESEVEYLKDGFTNGFDIGYEGLEHRQSTAANNPLKIGSKTQLWNKLMKEVKLSSQPL